MAHSCEGIETGSQRTARVLVVDDSRVIRMVLRSCLLSSDYLVDEADDGSSALRLLEDGAYDVVVSDLAMPGVDGFGLLAALQERPDRPEVVILTGSDEGDDGAARAMRLGASGYLTKPPKAPQTVVLAVGRALERKRERDGQRLRLH